MLLMYADMKARKTVDDQLTEKKVHAFNEEAQGFLPEIKKEAAE
ncbi:hypothetical protein [Metabacillus sp. RGM 3146]